MLPVLLFNVLSSLVVDKATDLATEHVENKIEDQLQETAKKELDKVIKDDPTNPHKTAKDALMAAAEGKLPIVKADGTLKPIELHFTLKYDPNTGSVDIEKK